MPISIIRKNTVFTFAFFFLATQMQLLFSKPAVKSCVAEAAPAGDVSEILHVKSELLTLRFTEPVHQILYRGELYLPGKGKSGEILIHDGSASDREGVTWAQLSIQWADPKYLPLNHVEEDSNILHMGLKSPLGCGGSEVSVPKSKIDVYQSEATSAVRKYSPDRKYIPLYVEISSPDHKTEMPTDFEDIFQDNPNASILVYEIEIE
jgi:hypothetical protein